MTEISIELVKQIPDGETFELPDELVGAILAFQANGFEVTFIGQSLEAYTSVDDGMPEAVAKYGAEALQFATTVVNRKVTATSSPNGLGALGT